MVRKKTLSLMLVATLALSPFTANAETSYYESNKKTYGITSTKTIKEVSKDVTSADYRDGSNALNLGVNGGDLTLTNNTMPSIVLSSQGEETSVYTVSQNGAIVVNDERFSGEGWSLFLKASPLSVVPSGDVIDSEWYVADTGKIKYAGVATISSVGTNATSTQPTGMESTADKAGAPTTVEYGNPVPLDEQPIRIAYAYRGEGMGSWELNDVLDKVSIHLDDTLKQDKKNYPNGPTPYQTRFQWTLVSGPGNK